MFFLEALVALVVAVLLTILLGRLTGREGGAGALVPVFLILFLFPWAGGLWMAPIGPLLFGFAWVPILVIAAILFLVILIASPPRKSRSHREQVRRKRDELRAQYGMSVAVGLLLIGGILLIAVGYVLR